MKQFFSVVAAATLMLSGMSACAQKAKEDKSKRPSPPAVITQVIASGATITIDYSRPSVKGRTIGENLEPKVGEVWRTGANEATIFETNKQVNINGKKLPAGKYALFTIWNKDQWVIIFNKTWNQWGAYDYKESEDVLRITVKDEVAPAFAEQFTFNADKTGNVHFVWGDHQVSFTVE